MMQESLASKYKSFIHEEVNLEGVLQFHLKAYFFRPQFSSTQKGRDTSAISND